MKLFMIRRVLLTPSSYPNPICSVNSVLVEDLNRVLVLAAVMAGGDFQFVWPSCRGIVLLQ